MMKKPSEIKKLAGNLRQGVEIFKDEFSKGETKTETPKTETPKTETPKEEKK